MVLACTVLAMRVQFKCLVGVAEEGSLCGGWELFVVLVLVFSEVVDYLQILPFIIFFLFLPITFSFCYGASAQYLSSPLHRSLH